MGVNPQAMMAPASRSRRVRLRELLRRGLGLIGLMAGLACLSLALPARRDRAATRPLAHQGAPALAAPTRSIERIALGDRVAGRNPLREQVDAAPEPEPKAWRAVTLRMVRQIKGDGANKCNHALVRSVPFYREAVELACQPQNGGVAGGNSGERPRNCHRI